MSKTIPVKGGMLNEMADVYTDTNGNICCTAMYGCYAKLYFTT